MTKQEITIQIDDQDLRSYSDSFLAMAWHVAQANPVPFDDYDAGELVERLAREIVRRWLRGVEPELWHHQGRHHPQRELSRFATYNPPEGWESLPAGSAEADQRFHSGRWTLKPEAAAALLPHCADVVTAAIAWGEAQKPGTPYATTDRAQNELVEALAAMSSAARVGDAEQVGGR